MGPKARTTKISSRELFVAHRQDGEHQRFAAKVRNMVGYTLCLGVAPPEVTSKVATNMVDLQAAQCMELGLLLLYLFFAV